MGETAGVEKTIASGSTEICTEAFGEPSDPPVLLIMGQMASMLWWPEELCERVARASRYVIRYDNRDTGLSTGNEPGEPTYSLDDLADDAVAVLDGYGIDRAHLVGMSLGGRIAQLVALAHPERVASVTAISTTRVGEPDPALPGPSAEYLKHSEAFEDLDWSDTDALGELLVGDARAVAGSRHPFDEVGARDLVTRDLNRATNPASLMNHAMLSGGEKYRDKLGELHTPVLVVHGTADPIFPHEHGVALAAAIPDATLMTIEGGGHELHEADWGQFLEAIIDHTATL